MNSPGLPDKCTFKQLLFNPAVGALLVLGRHHNCDPPVSRLYWRRRGERQYRQLGKPEPNVSFESPVVALAVPVMYFNVWRYTKLRRDRGPVGKNKKTKGVSWAGDWLGVYRADLRNGTVHSVLDKKELEVMASNERSWVSSLISTSNDGRGLYSVIGLEQKVNTSTKLPGLGKVQLTAHVEYHLYSLDLEARKLRKVTALEGAFC